jgi:large repetitive protein
MSFSSRFFLSVILLLLGPNLVSGQSISSFNPTFGSSSDLSFIDINGSGFSGGTLVVKFGNAQDTTAGATSDTHIQARVPASAPLGDCLISVSKNGGQPALSSQFFTVIGPGPYVTNFNPNIGSDNSTVTVGGAHFSGVTNVSFNGKSGTGLAVTLDYSLTVHAPIGVTSGPLTVKATNGTFTTASNFFALPTITGFSPSAGRSGTNVILTGTNFLGTTAIRFGTTLASDFTVLSNNAIRVTVPTGAQSGIFTLMAPAGSAQTTSSFVVQPTIFGFTPGFGPVGTSVTITGANFNVGTPSVKFGGVPAATPTGVSFSQLTAVVPPGATSGPVTLTTTDGASTSANLFYLPANITSYTPTNSAPGTTVRITGVNFTNASAVSFNGTSASFVVTNNTTIGAIVPAGFSTGPISVTTPAGTANSIGLFYAAPVITSFSPTHGLPGTNVVITGANFLGATVVRFNGTNASFTPPTNNTTLVAVVPNGAQTGPITVGAPGGTNTSAASFVLDYTSDVGVNVIDTPDPVFIGSNLTYTITVANSGPFNAPNVRLTNTLPASVTLKSATTTRGVLSTNSNPITGALGNITNGAPVIVTFTVVPNTLGTIIDTVSIASDNPDPASGNNTFNAFTTVLPLPVLTIRRAGQSQLNISWPVALTNFGLQFNSVLNAGVPWTNAGTPPVISGDQNIVTETNAGGSRFYRLKK